MQIPFGIAQIGRCFRNEIAPRDFLFRCREFHIGEFEFFIQPDEKKCNLLEKKHMNLKIKLLDEETQKKGKNDLKVYTLGEMLKSKKLDELYALGIDLINFTDDSNNVIDTLFKVYYGKEGADWIDWYLYERDPDGALDQATNDGKPICYDDQSLWEEVERCRLENKEEYSLPVWLNDEEREQILNMIKKGM
jgi:hypothetical protein